MKKLFKTILQWKLRLFTRLILKKYQPEVVAVTGSVGKTSTAEAIYLVLAAAFSVRKNLKNYNNEIGIPLSIIGSESGGKNIISWFGIFFKALGLLIIRDKNYPKILVLELGADDLGDIAYLAKMLPIKIGVVTNVAPVHIEFFGSIEKIAAEKGELIKAVPASGFAILNGDDKHVLPMAQTTKGDVITYGLTAAAVVRADNITVGQLEGGNSSGLTFNLVYHSKIIPVSLPQVIAEHLIYSGLAAMSVGLAYQLELPAIVAALRDFKPPRGRMNIIAGIKKTTIIDDSYNSSPLAVREALRQLSRFKPAGNGKRYAVLGDMLELGSITEAAHQEIGEAVVQYKIDYLVTVGEMSRDTIRGAVASGMSNDKYFNFENSAAAGKFLQSRISAGDLLLVKGSQGVRMEKIVKELMAQPEKAADWLVRQDPFWQ